MIQLADTWSRAEDRSLLESGMQRALGNIRLGDVLPKPMIEWQQEPVGFFTEILEVPERTIRWSVNPGYASHQWDATADPLIEVLEALRGDFDKRTVAVEAGTSTQKSWLLAGIYCWFTACWQDARTFTFAPKRDQLKLYSWMELEKWHWTKFKRQFPLAELSTASLTLRMLPGSDRWGVWGYPVQRKAGEEISSHAKGQHAEHLLLVYEECQAIDWPVIEAGKHTATAPHNLRLAQGNPLHQQDSLHRIAEEAGTHHIIISALDHPNVVTGDSSIVPGATSREHVEEILTELGETNPLYHAQVRGISPAEATNAFIKKAWCDVAVARAKDPEWRARFMADGTLPGLGVDVANVEGGDEAAVAKGIGALCLEVEEVEIRTGGRVENAQDLGTYVGILMGTMNVDQRHVGVDPVGVGASTVNELKRLRFYIQELAGSAAVQTDEDLLRESGRSYIMAGIFGNLRSQMWWQGRVDLEHGRVGLPDDPELLRDLVAVKWEHRRGQLWAQHKEEVVDDLGRSPNKGDAWINWNWVRHRRAVQEEEEPIRAFDPEVLEHEWREGRKVRSPRPEIPVDVDPTLIERVT